MLAIHIATSTACLTKCSKLSTNIVKLQLQLLVSKARFETCAFKRFRPATMPRGWRPFLNSIVIKQLVSH